jgi:hypothetical protein
LGKIKLYRLVKQKIQVIEGKTTQYYNWANGHGYPTLGLYIHAALLLWLEEFIVSKSGEKCTYEEEEKMKATRKVCSIILEKTMKMIKDKMNTSKFLDYKDGR